MTSRPNAQNLSRPIDDLLCHAQFSRKISETCGCRPGRRSRSPCSLSLPHAEDVMPGKSGSKQTIPP